MRDDGFGPIIRAMKSAVKLPLGVLVISVMLAACGGGVTTITVSATPSAGATPTSSPSRSVVAATNADLQALANQLYPTSSTGRQTCFDGDTTVAHCPITARLRTALEAIFAQQTGGGADPICGCQEVDPAMSFTYSLDASTGGGVIHMSQFSGSDRVDVVVIPQSGAFVADDIRYCSNTPPSSVYPGETVTC
jgi:hypothetical protein